MPTRALVTTYSYDAASDSRSVTVPSDCEVLEISICGISTGSVVNGITVGGNAMTSLGTVVHAGGKPRMTVWRLISPPTGSQTVAVTNAAQDKTGVAVNSWTAIDTTTPFDSFDTGTATTTGPSGGGSPTTRLTVASAVGDRVADAVASLSITAWAVGAGQTELWDFTPVDGRFAGSHEDGVAGNVEMTYTSGESKEWAGAAWNANASAGAPATRPKLHRVERFAAIERAGNR